MALPRKFFAPSFRHRRLGAFLSVIVGIMVFMAAFTMAAEASLSAMTLSWHRDVGNRLTVEIPYVEDEASVPQSERIKQAMSILRAMPGVAKATPVRDDEAARLLQPWISDPELLKALPVPALIEVERKSDIPLTADDVKQQLKPTLRDIRVDDHSQWLADLTRFVAGIAAFGGLMIVMATVTLALTVTLVCRAVMATERETITLLHVMGAEDNDIAKHFQSHARGLSMMAAFGGFILALACAGALLYFMRNFAHPALLGRAHWVALACMVLAVPLVAVWIASVSARVSVLNYLRSMP